MSARQSRPTRRPRRRIAGPSASSANNPEHYDGLEDGDDVPAQGSDSPNESVAEMLNSLDSGESEDDDGLTPSGRMAEVEEGSKAYAKEYRLGMLARLLMRKIPLDEIAKQLNVSVRTVQRDRDELYRRMQQEAGDMDLNEYVGDTMTFFKEMRAMTLRIATSSKNPLSSRLAAASRSMQAQKDMTAVLQAAGVFDVLKFKAEADAGNKDLKDLISSVESLFDETEGLEDMNVTLEEEDDIVRLL